MFGKPLGAFFPQLVFHATCHEPEPVFGRRERKHRSTCLHVLWQLHRTIDAAHPRRLALAANLTAWM
jgi:hypothetical protein